jgi:hypothetical protein
MFQGLHVICECKAGLRKLGKTTHKVCFEVEIQFQDMHCCSDVVVARSLLGPRDSPLVASLDLGAQPEGLLVPFESSLFPGVRSTLVFDGSLPQDFERSDWSAQLEIQQ